MSGCAISMVFMVTLSASNIPVKVDADVFQTTPAKCMITQKSFSTAALKRQFIRDNQGRYMGYQSCTPCSYYRSKDEATKVAEIQRVTLHKLLRESWTKGTPRMKHWKPKAKGLSLDDKEALKRLEKFVK
jgi:hypothetical protein